MNDIQVPVVPVEKEDQVTKQILISSAKEREESNKSNYYDCTLLEDIELVLHGIGMEKYIDLFQESNITLEMFLQFDESDLKELGITNSKDIKTIMENIRVYDTRRKLWAVPADLLQDLQIARNVSRELVLLQHYCSYLELQMRKYKLSDYRINWKESASTYLKAFINTSLIQTKILSQKVFTNIGDNHLIGKALKLDNITLPKDLEERLKEKKPERKLIIFRSAVIFGILSVAVLVRMVLKN